MFVLIPEPDHTSSPSPEIHRGSARGPHQLSLIGLLSPESTYHLRVRYPLSVMMRL